MKYMQTLERTTTPKKRIRSVRPTYLIVLFKKRTVPYKNRVVPCEKRIVSHTKRIV